MIFDSAMNLSKAFLQPVELLAEVPFNIFIKRFDLLHPAIYGNKWFELKSNITRYHRNKDWECLSVLISGIPSHIFLSLIVQ